MKSGYSKRIRHDLKLFRYNHNEALLEWIDDDGIVIDSIGLSREEWKENRQYWIEVWSEELNEETERLMADFRNEMLDLEENFDSSESGID